MITKTKTRSPNLLKIEKPSIFLDSCVGKKNIQITIPARERERETGKVVFLRKLSVMDDYLRLRNYQRCIPLFKL